MIRFFKVVFLFTISLAIFSCNKADETTTAYVVPYAEQYPVDIAAIEAFLKTHSIDFKNSLNQTDDQDVTFATVTAGDVNSIWGSDPSTPKASLLNKIVNRDGIDYKIYYMPSFVRSAEQFGTKDSPTRVDSVFVSYKGHLLNETVFDQAQNPVWFPLDNVIQGWKEIMPLFKSGNYNTISPIVFTDFGAGVMFLPSALGYYNGSVTGIPSYSPLVFSFKLKVVNYVDHDYDRIDSQFEDINGNGNLADDDTDGDGRPNYLDQDDDGDGYLTKFEIKRPQVQARDQNGILIFDTLGNPVMVSNGYYPFQGALVDDPLTIDIDERQGIPDCSGVPDYTTLTRVRKHLNSACHN